MRFNTEILPKSMGSGVGIAIVFGTSIDSAGMNYLATTMAWSLQGPLILGAMVGAMLLSVPTLLLQRRIDRTFKLDTEPMKNRSYHFLLQAASMTLGTLVGLAMTTAFMSIIANPFTLPALIAAGISALIMFGVYVKTKPTAAQELTPRRPLSANGATMLNAANRGVFGANTNLALQVILDPNLRHATRVSR